MKLKRCTPGKRAKESEVAVAPLVQATLPERFEPDPAAGGAHVEHPFGSAAQNGRLSANLGAPTMYRWIARFETPLRRDTRAHSVMYLGDRILVQARTWQLFGLDGRPVRSGLGGASPITLSPFDATFRFVGPDGTLDAHRLSDGEALWSCGAPLQDRGAYNVLATRGTSTLLAASERAVNPEAEGFAPEFAAQWIDGTEKPEVSPAGLLRNAVRSPLLVGPAQGELLGVANEQGAVFAVKDHLLYTDPALDVTRVVTERFDPRAMSLGGRGRVYLVVDTPGGAALWMLNAQGERVFSTPLGASTRIPPIVTLDHRVFVTTASEIIALSPEGAILWRAPSPGRAPRVAVSADGWLLASMNEELRVFDAVGRSAVLSYSVDRPFVTAPIITADGEILVATTETLVCLAYEELTYAAGYHHG